VQVRCRNRTRAEIQRVGPATGAKTGVVLALHPLVLRWRIIDRQPAGEDVAESYPVSSMAALGLGIRTQRGMIAVAMLPA
jgi:hypothetical protein